MSIYRKKKKISPTSFIFAGLFYLFLRPRNIQGQNIEEIEIHNLLAFSHYRHEQEFK